MFITVMLVIFWIIPVGFATALANLNTIAGISWMSWLIDVLGKFCLNVNPNIQMLYRFCAVSLRVCYLILC